jgi:predicted permease
MTSMNSFDSSTPPLAPLPPPIFQAISTFDPVPVIDNIFRQTSHRAISLAIWLIVGRLVLALWPRTFDFSFYLLPAALGCLALALPAAFLSLTVARHRSQNERAQWGLILVSLVLAVLVAGWMFLPKLAWLLFHARVFH